MMILAQEFHQNLIQYYLDQLFSPMGIVFLVTGLLAAAVVLALDGLRWFVLAVGIYLASYSYERLKQGSVELPLPFGYLVQLSQLVTIAVLGLFAVAVLKPVAWHRRNLVHPALICLLILQLVLSVRQMTGGLGTKGIIGCLIYVANFLILGLGVSRWLHNANHARSLIKAMSWVAGLMILCTTAVFVLNIDAAFINGRLAGTTENPQRVAVLLAMAIPFSCTILADPESAKSSRIIHGVIAGITAAFLVMTSSRTGGLTALVGLVVLFRRRISGFAIVAIVFVAFGLLVSTFTEERFSAAGTHLLRLNNSRTEYWMEAVRDFLAAPLFGNPGIYVRTENSYLSAAAAGGIIALIPLGLMMFFLIRSTISLARSAKYMGTYSIAADAVCAGVAQLSVAWLLEGYMLGLMTDHIFTTYLILALLAFLLERRDDLMADASTFEMEQTDMSPELKHQGVAHA